MATEPIILLVEDNRDDEELTLIAFQENQIRNKVTVVRDGQEAIDYIFREGKYSDLKNTRLPQVVLLDLKLPKVSGLEVLKRIRENESTRFMPVVVLTSSKEERDLVESYRLGANAYVRKPVEFEQFNSAVRQLGLFWLLWNETPPCRGELPHG